MQVLDRLWRIVFAVLTLSALCAASHAATKPRIIPLRANVAFSAAQSAQNHWSVPIKSVDGRTAYVLSLEPDDVFHTDDHHVEGLELVLRRPHDQPDAQNLLAAIRNWHGVQDFMFPAWDFKQGVKKSLYGKKRTISVEKLGLVVQVVVSKAEVSLTTAIPGVDYQLDALDLQIEVNNAADK
jgi:hypothetical protein